MMTIHVAPWHFTAFPYPVGQNVYFSFCLHSVLSLSLSLLIYTLLTMDGTPFAFPSNLIDSSSISHANLYQFPITLSSCHIL